MKRAWRDPLRWYPAAWRARYGDEMRALLDERAIAGRVRLRDRWSLVGHGLVERLRAIFGERLPASPEARWRDGAVRVLAAWAAFMVGGAGFAKASEHFSAALPAGSRALPNAAFALVFVGGIAGGGLVLLGALLAGPASARMLRNGGWRLVRGRVVRAAVVTVVAIVSTIALAAWAHGLSVHARNGGSAGYSALFAAWVVLGTVCLAMWTGVAIAVGRRVPLGAHLLRFEAALALALSVVMLVVTLAAAIWWAAMATSAPWFLDGSARGTNGSAFDASLVVALVVMSAALAVSMAGAARIARPRLLQR